MARVDASPHTEQPTSSDWRVFRRLLALMAPFWRLMLLAVVLSVITIGSSIALMASGALIIARAALRPSIAELSIAIVGVRFFGITRGLFRYLERLVSHEVTFRMLSRLRVWFYTALEPLAPAHLLRYRSGDLLARVMSDIETLEHFYLRVLAPPLVAVIVVGGVIAALGLFHVSIGLVALLFLVMAGLVLPVLTHIASRRTGRQGVQTRADLDIAALDGIQGAAELVAFGRAGDHLAQVNALSAQIADEQRVMARIEALHGAFHLLLIGCAVAGVLVAAIPLVTAGSLDGVNLSVIALVMLASFEAVQNIPTSLQFLSESLAAGARIFEIADAQAQVSDPPQPAATLPQQYGLHFENVAFRYGDDEPQALRGVSFDVLPGERVAVVGPSGAGKSTLVNLLLRFWEAEAGTVRVGERDLRDLTAHQARDLFGVVTQSTYLFNTTVRENLLIGRRDATDEQVIAAAQAAQIHDFIMTLPDGYDTYVGEQGLQLSGGERQRIAIARALLKDAPILLLDEATANLDSVTELAVQDAIRNLMVGRTTLVITHRLAGLDTMDRVIVLRDGQVVEQGTHAELMQAQGVYRRMWSIQHSLIAVA